MATIKLKHSTAEGSTPSLAAGEIAFNLFDRKLFYYRFVSGGNSIVADFVADYLAVNSYVIDSGEVPSPPPEEPSNVTVVAGDRSIDVAWTEPFSELPITGYSIRVLETDDDGATVSDTLVDVSGDAIQHTITGLANGVGVYFISVAATNANGASSYASPAAASGVTPSAGPPITFTNAALRSDNTGTGYGSSLYRWGDVSSGSPSRVTLAVAGTATVVVYGNGNGDDDHEVRVRNAASGNTTLVWRGDAGKRTFTFIGSPELGTYLQFRKQNDNGSLPGELRTFSLDIGTTPTVAAFHASPSPKGALLSWNVGNGGSPVTSWKVEYSPDNTNWAPAYSASGNNLVRDNRAVSVPGLTDGSVYYWRIRALNLNGFSEYADAVAVTAGPRYIDTSASALSYTGVGTAASKLYAEADRTETYPVNAPVNGTFFFRATTGDAGENDLYYPTNLAGGRSGRVNVAAFENSFDATAGTSGSMSFQWNGYGDVSFWFVPWIIDRSHTSFRGPGTPEYPMRSVTLTSTSRSFTALRSGQLTYTANHGSDGGESTSIRLSSSGVKLASSSELRSSATRTVTVTAGVTYTFEFGYGSNSISNAYITEP